MSKIEVMDLEYNSQRDNLTIPEYGRHIQKMIDYAKTIEDTEKRQAIAEKIIELMFQLSVKGRNISEYSDKLWKHLFRIADYDLDVVAPGDEQPQKTDNLKPEPIDYPTNKIRYRHYGRFVYKMIEKAKQFEDPEKKRQFGIIIATYMKNANIQWGSSMFINDDTIKENLKNLSDGDIELDSKVILRTIATPPTPQNKKYSKGQNRKQKYAPKRRKRR